MDRLWIFCADIGSVAKSRFGWASLSTERNEFRSGTDIEVLVSQVAERLNSGDAVALGFECPLYVPLAHKPVHLTSARRGEGNRPWSAGAGSGALATGLAEVPWILRAIRARMSLPRPAFVRWDQFEDSGMGLFLWEAFVTSTAKRDSHANDAVAAVERFRDALPNAARSHALKDGEVFSLLGAAMLRTGWAADLSLMATPVLVIRA
jgi:hypothetical protein